MRTSKELAAEIEAARAKVSAIVALAKQEEREMNAEESTEVDSLVGTDNKPGKIQELVEARERALKIEAQVSAVTQKMIETEAVASAPVIKVPARAKAANRLYAFKKEEDAYVSGQWVLANLYGNRKAKAWCKDHGIKATMTTFDNPSGGYLVPDVLESTIVELRENFGVARRECMQVTMGDAKMNMPKLTQEVTAYYVGETQTITSSDLAVQTITLDAKKLAANVVVSSELNEDSVISIGEMIARSVAQTFANEEDKALFNGTGTSATGGIVGLAGSLAAGSLVTAAATRDLFADLTFAEFESMIGARKMWAGSNPKWYISQAGWAASMQRLANAAGGVTMAEIADGTSTMMFLGYPVVISQVLTSALTSTTGLRACYFGDLQNGAYLGTRRGISLAVDTSLGFLTDTLNIRATQRFDIVVHDNGTASASGGIIGLVFGST